jgi:mRNA guanylyltransferase
MPTGGFLEHKFHMQTLLDGEIVMDIMKDGTERLKFLVFDALVVDNKNLMRRSLSTRLGVMMSIAHLLTQYFMDYILKPYRALLKKYPDAFSEVPFMYPSLYIV